MVCPNCGKECGGAFCAVCGTALNAPTPTNDSKPPVSEKRKIICNVIYFISAAFALFNLFLPVFPQVYRNSKGFMNFFEIFIYIMDNASSSSRTGFFGSNDEACAVITFFFCSFVIIMCLLLVWSVMSLLRRRSAGGWGFVANGLLMVISIIWITQIYNGVHFKGFITAFPGLNLFFAVQGLVYSVVQLVFRGVVRDKLTKEQKSVKTKGASVVFIISGVIGALNALTAFLPCYSYSDPSAKHFKHTPMSMIQFTGKAFDGSIEGNTSTVAVLFFISTALLIAWAVLSFMKKPVAGFVGLAASVIAFVFSIVYDIMISFFGADDLYFLVILLSIAGIVFSGIQIAKRKRV